MKINLQNNLKWLFIISILWLLLEGIFRKWFFLNLSGPLFYVKYILFGITYISYLFGNNRSPKIVHGYQYLIILFIFMCIIGFMNNTLNNSIVVGIIGLIVHLFFIPLIHISQFIFNTMDTINKFIKVLVIVSLPICILGMIQFYLPVDHILNGFTNENQLVTRIEKFTRISSIFSFVKIYNAYLLFAITIITVSILNKLLKNESVIFYSFVFLLLITNMFMTGSRLSIGLMFINFIAIGSYVFIVSKGLRKTVFVVFIMGILTVSFLYLTTDLVKDPIDATISRVEKAESRHRTESTGYTDVELRFKDRIDIFKFSESAGWLGYGIGTTYQGSAGLIKNPIPFYFEEEGERIVLELGIIGGIIVVLMRFIILIFVLTFLVWCKSVEIKLFLLALLLYITPSVITIQMTTFSYLENFLYYFAIGLIIALYKIYQNQSSIQE